MGHIFKKVKTSPGMPGILNSKTSDLISTTFLISALQLINTSEKGPAPAAFAHTPQYFIASGHLSGFLQPCFFRLIPLPLNAQIQILPCFSSAKAAITCMATEFIYD